MKEDINPAIPGSNPNNIAGIKAGPVKIGKKQKGGKQGSQAPPMDTQIIMASKTYSQRLIEKIHQNIDEFLSTDRRIEAKKRQEHEMRLSSIAKKAGFEKGAKLHLNKAAHYDKLVGPHNIQVQEMAHGNYMNWLRTTQNKGAKSYHKVNKELHAFDKDGKKIGSWDHAKKIGITEESMKEEIINESNDQVIIHPEHQEKYPHLIRKRMYIMKGMPVLNKANHLVAVHRDSHNIDWHEIPKAHLKKPGKKELMDWYSSKHLKENLDESTTWKATPGDRVQVKLRKENKGYGTLIAVHHGDKKLYDVKYDDGQVGRYTAEWITPVGEELLNDQEIITSVDDLKPIFEAAMKKKPKERESIAKKVGRARTLTGKQAHKVIVDPKMPSTDNQNLSTMKRNQQQSAPDRGI